MSPARPLQFAEVELWCDRYRAFRRKRVDTRFADFKRDFRRLGEGLKPIKVRAAKRARKETPDFNVFRILRLAHREVVTHTPFLTNLLDPAGTHAQGDLFLRLFLNRLAHKQVAVPTLRAGERWQVFTEQVTELGNFDIHLRSHSLRCQIVIENKIGAADQEDQLARYWKQMQKERAEFDYQPLVYLTPQPREPLATLQPLPPFTNLTYRDDICAILQSGLEVIPSPRLRYSLEQYLEIAKTC